MTGNTVVGTGALVQWQAGTSASSAREWNRNTYFGGNASPFKLAAGTNTFSNWKSKTGFDGASTYSASLPAQTRSFVIPNRYETGRAHVVVYNWESASSASVDLSAIGLRSGQAFEVRDAQNFFGPPVYTGTYSGGAVSLNLNLSAVAPIIGNRHLTNTHTEPKFNVFVVLPRG